MTLGQYLKIIELTDPLEQLKVLGCPSDISVKKSKELIKKELTFDFEPKEIKSFKIAGRKFKLQDDIENMVATEYAYFKSIIGDIYADKVDDEDKIIEVPDEEKHKKLFLESHKIIGVFTKEATLFKKRNIFLRKKLNYVSKCELFKKMDVQMLINIVFFYLKLMENLLINGQIYYMEKKQETLDKITE